jgi:antitoxin (DNA-binding transcriptional repressor) of toxin-antitoxin stability system
MEISVKEAKNQLSDLLRRVEAGEKVTVTRDGQPVVDLVKHVPKKRGLNWEAVRDYKRQHGIDRFVDYIPADFDEPLPEDFLLQPLPNLPESK